MAFSAAAAAASKSEVTPTAPATACPSVPPTLSASTSTRSTSADSFNKSSTFESLSNATSTASSLTSGGSSPLTTATASPPRAQSLFNLPNARGPGTCKAEQIFPRMELLLPGEPVAMDVEFQNYQRAGEKGGVRLGWIAVVNTKGETILECHVNYPVEKDVKMSVPGAWLGFRVAFDDLKMKNGAIPAACAEKWCAEIFSGRKVVLHGGSGDLKSFMYEDAFGLAEVVIDTQHLYGRVGLAKLTAQEFPNLGAIQVDHHTPVEDAQATMNLYLKKLPYDRIEEKAALVAQGLATTCKPSDEQVRQVQQVKQKHRQAVQHAEQYARSQAKRGGVGGGRGRGKA